MVRKIEIMEVSPRDGIDLPAVMDAAKWLEGDIGCPNPAMLGRARLFPPVSKAA